MSKLRLTRAKDLLRQAETLRGEIQQNISENKFPDDDLHMKTYNDLIEAASELFLEDPILNGQMVIMPDAVLQSYNGWIFPPGTMPPELPSQRTKQHLTRLINRLELLLGEESTQQPLDERDFSFVTDQKLRKVLSLDFIEAQKAFNAEVYKACGLLCGGLIEGMLLDICQKPGLITEHRLREVSEKLKLPRRGQCIDGDKVSMTNLIKMSSELGLVSEPALKFAEGARDIRDTVHPHAEVRQEHRVLGDEAEILLQLVKLIYNDLAAKFSEGIK